MKPGEISLVFSFFFEGGEISLVKKKTEVNARVDISVGPAGSEMEMEYWARLICNIA